MRLTFSDDFGQFRSSPTGIDDTGRPVWQTAYELFTGYLTRTLAPGNPESQWYSDASTGTNPFTANGATLTITASPAHDLPMGMTHTSGMITTRKSFAQTYGYFETSMKLPVGLGFWPAFWMLRVDGVWPPEFDIMEASSSQVNVVLTSDLSGPIDNREEHGAAHYLPDPTGWHAYGLSWRPDMLRFYIDGAEVFSTPTPAEAHAPMYMVTTLSVGDDRPWPGPADGVSSGTLEIDYIRAWGYDDIAPTMPPVLTMRVLTGTAAAETLTGGATDDRLESRGGNDTLTGGGGADRFVFANHTGTDIVTDFQSGTDRLIIQSTAPITAQTLTLGTQLTFGTSTVMLAGVFDIQPGDIVAGAGSKAGGTGSDLIDRSSIAIPSDSIDGAAGNDTIRGSAGDDWIKGGWGNDVLTGNVGADSFMFWPGAGNDTITDFRPGDDRLVFKGVNSTSIHPTWDAVAGVDGMRIAYGASGDSVFLAGMNNSLMPGSIYVTY